LYVLLKRADLLFGGFLLAFASSPGQTWFIALSGPALGAELNLSHGAFGTLYALATLGSGLTLMWLGGKIDVLAPRWMASGIAIGLGLSCLAMASVDSPLALLMVFFGLRLCGQGLMSQLAMTVVARGFPDARGRALACAGLGYPAAEGLVPMLVVLALGSLGWRMTWLVAGGVALLALPPALVWLLRRARTVAHGTGGSSPMIAPLRRREILLSVRFFLLLPALLTTGFVITAVFFHQGALSQAKDWPPGWFAVCIPGYAVASVIATLTAGFLVDRRGARRILPLFLLPLSAGLALLATTATPRLALVAIALAGLTAGASNTIITAALTELYGTASIAMVRALCASAMIVASALSPALVGIALDAGVTMDAVLFACLGLSLAAGLLAARGISRGAAPLTQRGMS
jgi:MFS family permease